MIMDAMMPLVSHAPRPQMYSSSSREAKNGGTVSMCVESVTVEPLAPLREDVEAARLHLDALDAAVEAGGERRQVVEEELPDALFVVGDRFDIDQRARELENVHKSIIRGGGTREGKRRRRTAGVSSIPIALHPPEKRVTVSRY